MAFTVRHKPIIINVFAYVGDTIDSWSIKFKDSDGNPYDISDIDFYYIVKASFRTADTDAVITKDPADAVKTASVDETIDTLSFPLPPSDTEVSPRKYVHAIKILDGTDERTWMEGAIEFEQRRIDTI